MARGHVQSYVLAGEYSGDDGVEHRLQGSTTRGGEATLETSGRPEMVSKQKHDCGDGKRERFRRYSLPARVLLGCG